MTIMTNLERITIFSDGIFLFHFFLCRKEKTFQVFQRSILRQSTENRLVYFFGPVGSLMLRDSDYVCDGEYGNSENVCLL